LEAQPPQATICVRRLVFLWVKIFRNLFIEYLL